MDSRAMQSNSQTTSSILVDSLESLQSFMNELANLVNSPSRPSLFLDLEGSNLCRHGTISILTILVHERENPDHIYVLDIRTLGGSAFTTASTISSITLQDVLEDLLIKKFFFDVRNDSDALFSHFGIQMNGVMDLQLMENASRPSRGKRLVHGLAKCVREDSDISAAAKRDWELSKDRGRHLFSPEHGGRLEIFDERPLNEEIRKYCEQDVRCLPSLYENYSARLEDSGNLLNQISLETTRRIQESMSANYEPHGRDKALAPKWEERGDSDEWDDMTARDCPGWEDDMIKNGEWF